MESTRLNRVSKLLQKDLGEIMQFEMKHINKGAMVTVTKVKVTSDLSLAKIYLSLFASKDKESLLNEIRKHTGEIRGKLGNRVRYQLRVIPELRFYEDDSLDYIENIEHLLEDD